MSMNIPFSILGSSCVNWIIRDRVMSAVCRGCGGNHFVDDTQSGDRVCTICGEVQLQNMLSEEPEWRSYKEEGILYRNSIIYRKCG